MLGINGFSNLFKKNIFKIKLFTTNRKVDVLVIVKVGASQSKRNKQIRNSNFRSKKLSKLLVKIFIEVDFCKS
jgi:hypothetical protein